MAWMVPARTVRSTPSLATTPGKRLTMSRSSIAIGLPTVVVVTELLIRRRRHPHSARSWAQVLLHRERRERGSAFAEPLSSSDRHESRDHMMWYVFVRPWWDRSGRRSRR